IMPVVPINAAIPRRHDYRHGPVVDRAKRMVLVVGRLAECRGSIDGRASVNGRSIAIVVRSADTNAVIALLNEGLRLGGVWQGDSDRNDCRGKSCFRHE